MCGLDSVQVHDNERILVVKGEQAALFSIDGRTLIDFYNGWIYELDEFYVLKSKEKYGIASKDGKTKTDIIYDDISYEKTNIIVTLNKKKGVYNLNCEAVLSVEFDKIGIYDKYIVTVPNIKNINRRQVYTLDGKKIIFDSDELFWVSSNYAGILIETKAKKDAYFLYSFNGSPILEGYNHMEFGDELADGSIIASKDGKAGLFDLDGKELLPCKYKCIRYGAGSSYEAKLVTVRDDNNRQAIYSTKEKNFVLPFGHYSCIESYKKGICELISKDKVHGYYLTKVKKFIAANDINITKSGRYELSINGEWEMLEI